MLFSGVHEAHLSGRTLSSRSDEQDEDGNEDGEGNDCTEVDEDVVDGDDQDDTSGTQGQSSRTTSTSHWKRHSWTTSERMLTKSWARPLKTLSGNSRP